MTKSKDKCSETRSPLSFRIVPKGPKLKVPPKATTPPKQVFRMEVRQPPEIPQGDGPLSQRAKLEAYNSLRAMGVAIDMDDLGTYRTPNRQSVVVTIKATFQTPPLAEVLRKQDAIFQELEQEKAARREREEKLEQDRQQLELDRLVHEQRRDRAERMIERGLSICRRALLDYYIKELLRMPQVRRNLTSEEWDNFLGMDDLDVAAPIHAPISLVALLKGSDGDATTSSLRERHNTQAHVFSYVDFVEATAQCREEKEATLCKLIMNFKYGNTIFEV